MSREQKLVDLTFSIALALHDNPGWLSHQTKEEVAAWVADMLRGCGFLTEPVGSSWGILKEVGLRGLHYVEDPKTGDLKLVTTTVEPQRG